jgi:hypothetical protein
MYFATEFPLLIKSIYFGNWDLAGIVKEKSKEAF